MKYPFRHPLQHRKAPRTGGYGKYILLGLLLMTACLPLSAQMEDGSYQGFEVIKGQEQPDIISINVLSLGNGICQFSNAGDKKPLQGTYHIILNRIKYNIGNFKKGIANGDWEEYIRQSLYEKGVYKNGKYDGKVYRYGVDGLENKYPTVFTLKDGVFQHYISYHSENGQVQFERFYDSEGRLHGEIRGYDKDGKLTESENYRNDKRHGKQMRIDSSGYKEMSEYADGKQTGDYCRYFPNGNVYNKGMYDETGKKTGKWIYGEDNGDVKSEINYLADKRNGEERTYYKGNKIRSIEQYVDDKLNGKRIDYDEDPHVISYDISYVNGQKNGPFKMYHKGILWREGISKEGRTVYEKEYQDGKLQIIRLLDEHGSLVNVEQYNKAGQKTYKNQTYKKHPSIKLKEDASGVVDVEVD